MICATAVAASTTISGPGTRRGRRWYHARKTIEAAPILPEMLARSPGLKILVSSRIALRVSGEQEFAVPGLPTPPDPTRLPELERLNLPAGLRRVTAATLEGFDSAQLFAARARAVRPDFELTDANAPAVARITARLHGMPLAIELAAARIKLLSSEQIVDRLGKNVRESVALRWAKTHGETIAKQLEARLFAPLVEHLERQSSSLRAAADALGREAAALAGRKEEG